ncbi:MAG: hypothetical protein KC561_03280 [Myxococcales bacterium]|nr:hypothetical protein [Myxococcales bacterium]
MNESTQILRILGRTVARGQVHPGMLSDLASECAEPALRDKLRRVAHLVEQGHELPEALSEVSAFDEPSLVSLRTRRAEVVEAVANAHDRAYGYRRSARRSLYSGLALFAATYLVVVAGSRGLLPLLWATLEREAIDVPLLWSKALNTLSVVTGPIGWAAVLIGLAFCLHQPRWFLRLSQSRWEIALRAAAMEVVWAMLDAGESLDRATLLAAQILPTSRTKAELERAAGRLQRGTEAGMALAEGGILGEFSSLWRGVGTRGTEQLQSLSAAIGRILWMRAEVATADMPQRGRVTSAYLGGALILFASLSLLGALFSLLIFAGTP